MLFTVVGNHSDKYFIPVTSGIISEFDKNVAHELKSPWRTQDQRALAGYTLSSAHQLLHPEMNPGHVPQESPGSQVRNPCWKGKPSQYDQG